MTHQQIASRAEWLVARKALLMKEKEETRLRDALSAERSRMPMVKVDEEYTFEGPSGVVNLRDLFNGLPQLVVYHFMFEPDWADGCKSCSHFMDNMAGSVVHLRARDTSFAVVSLAPIVKIEPFKMRMGWTFPWFSSFGGDFNRDFQVTIDAADPASQYNYASAAALAGAKKTPAAAGVLWAQS